MGFLDAREHALATGLLASECREEPAIQILVANTQWSLLLLLCREPDSLRGNLRKSG